MSRSLGGHFIISVIFSASDQTTPPSLHPSLAARTPALQPALQPWAVPEGRELADTYPQSLVHSMSTVD